MKKTVVFHLAYEGQTHKGNSTEKVTYKSWIPVSKNRIIRDFFDWVNSENERMKEACGEPVCLYNLKIIGL